MNHQTGTHHQEQLLTQSINRSHAIDSLDTILVFGGSGGAGTSTLVRHLQKIGLRAFEPQCRCVVEQLLIDQQSPPAKVVVVKASYYGVSKAAELTAQYPVNLVAVVRDSPLTIPFSVRLKLRALTGRADIILFPHVWKWRSGKTNHVSSRYNNSLKFLANRIHHHMKMAQTN